MGGLPKKAQQLEELRKGKKAVLALDSGALLFKEEKIPPDQQQQLTTTAQGIVSAYNRMSFAAVGVARQDLAAGLAFLLSLQQKSDFPWLSANLVSRSQAKPYFKPHLVLRKGGIRIGVIGLTGPGPDAILPQKDNAVILPWDDVLPKEIAVLKGQTDMLVLLSNLPAPINRKIAETHPEIQLIVQAGTGSGNLVPERVNNTLITQVEQQGKSIGILEVRWNRHSRKWEDPGAKNLLLDKKNELDRLGWQINRYRKHGDPKLAFKGQAEVLAAYEELLAQRERLDQELCRLTKEENSRNAQGAQFSSFSHHFEAMRKELPDNPAVRAIVNATTSEVNRIGKNAAKARIADSSGENQKGSSGNYAGSTACTGCHAPQFAKWRGTQHAMAYDTLEAKGQQFNVQCLPCHITGPAAQTGQEMLALAHDLRQVGCESCHGPARAHTLQPAVAKAGRPTMDTCLRCHSGEHDDRFVFAEALSRLRCGAD
ncbi:UshA-like (seleno)protein [Desulfobacterales bacterium RS19-109]|uniref:UshA-like (Seleno)protein n=1 Tax=Thiovibrio frasassiensis TaxID=2984131 RepID=A0A9X4MPF3_9BACT|nr:UshA-like (seleno)protein [Thiovibrio frasassiensis]